MKRFFFLLTFSAVFLSAFSTSYAKDAVLINLNPDPEGESWIAGGDIEMTQEEQSRFLPLVVPGSIAKRQLPEQWDNSTAKEFRPVFNQKGGSCAQASGIAYTFTYEINCLRNLASNVAQNQYPYGFTYNFLNSGSTSNGSSYSSGWSIIKVTGCPPVSDYFGTLEGGDGSKWLNGYSAYYNGMKNRVQATDISIKVTTEKGINDLKQWLYDHAGEQAKGGLVTFSSYASGSQVSALPSGTPQAGKKAVIKWGTSSGGHAMTIGGWDDSVRWDYNGDGQYTNTKDINNDGTVDPRDWEIGAVIMINSWGSSWGNSGKAYMMYWVLANLYDVGGIKSSNTVYGIHCYKEYTPKLTYKVTVTHDTRNLIRVRTGMSNNTSATTPVETHSFSSAFNYSGGAFPLEGNALSSTLEIGLDVTPLLDKMTGTKAKFFLAIDSKGGAGKVGSFSIIDYTGASPVETKCDQTDVVITPGSSSSAQVTYLSVLFSAQPTPASSVSSSAAPFSLQIVEGKLVFTMPRHSENSVLFTVYNARGAVVNKTAGRYCAGKHAIPLQSLVGKNENAAGRYLCTITANKISKTVSFYLTR